MSEERFTQEKTARGDVYADGGARDLSVFEDFLAVTGVHAPRREKDAQAVCRAFISEVRETSQV